MSEPLSAHWENVYSTKGEEDVSWFEADPQTSLDLFDLVGAQPDWGVIDIGGGASRLVDKLVERGFSDLTVLDLSAAALERARVRLGASGDGVQWLQADATDWQPPRQYDLWHDRAAFHFLVREEDRNAYLSRLRAALRPGGYAIFATFAPDGPEKCSGLPVVRYDASSLGAVLGEGFELVGSRRHDHRTPWDAVQKFQFAIFRKRA